MMFAPKKNNTLTNQKTLTTSLHHTYYLTQIQYMQLMVIKYCANTNLLLRTAPVNMNNYQV